MADVTLGRAPGPAALLPGIDWRVAGAALLALAGGGLWIGESISGT